ncbi:MAG: lipid-A-disaccharide synthase, partial [Nitrospirae bacterium]
MEKHIFIVAGEASGELYGALLCRALKKIVPNVHIHGMGGSMMAEEGVRLITSISGSHGLIETFRLLRKLKSDFDLLLKEIKKIRPNVVVLIDYPDFNIPLLKGIKKLNIPVLYYVSPTVWAWRRNRAKTIAAYADAIALIFPFELDIYRPLGIKSEFVGHPVLDYHEEILPERLTKEEAKESLGSSPDKITVALMPGSRNSEIKNLLPLIIGSARELKKRYKNNIEFFMPLVHSIDVSLDEYINIVDRKRVGEVLSASDVGIIASGTAALEACFFGTPLVMIYKLSPITFFLAKRLIKVNYISHVNMIVNREVVPELIQDRANVNNIVMYVDKIIHDEAFRRNMLDAFIKVREI